MSEINNWEENPKIRLDSERKGHRKKQMPTEKHVTMWKKDEAEREWRRKYPISELVTVTALTEEREVIHKSSAWLHDSSCCACTALTLIVLNKKILKYLYSHIKVFFSLNNLLKREAPAADLLRWLFKLNMRSHRNVSTPRRLSICKAATVFELQLWTVCFPA